MILTDYYRFERLATKSKQRMDCTASTGSYEPLEEKRANRATKETDKRDATAVGSLVIYFGDVPETFGGNVHRKADKSVTIKGNNMSSVYLPDVKSGFAFGDMRGTSDALLFVLQNVSTPNGRIETGAVIEVFVARGQRNNARQLYYLMADGELDEEMECLRCSVTKSVTGS